MKKSIIFLTSIFTIFTILTGCGGTGKTEVDYTTKEFEDALNEGDDLEGKTVSITVDKLVPDSAFGYNIQTGEHLNFVSNDNPKVEEGDELVLEATEVKSVAGSFIIYYKKK